MTSDMDERAREYGLLSGVREAIGLHSVALVLMGITAGYSASVLGTDVVALPVVGPVPGLVVGGVGLTASVIAYLKVGCCGDCGSKTAGLTGGCGCAGDCEDSCSVDP